MDQERAELDKSILIPTPWVAGDTITWDTCPWDDYSPTTHNLQWVIQGPSYLSLIGLVGSDGWITTAAANATGPMLPGRYRWTAQMILIATTARTTVGSGGLELLPDPILADPLDARSTAAQLLDLVESALKARLEGGAVQSYAIRGRNLAYMALTELVHLRQQLRAEVSRERAAESIAQGKGDPRRAYVRFS